MGSEWAQKVAKSFEKRWDKGRVLAATADLFTREPGRLQRTVSVDLREGIRVDVGESVVVQKKGGHYLVHRGLCLIGSIDGPTSEIREAIEQSAEVSCGVVEAVFELSRTMEVVLW